MKLVDIYLTSLAGWTLNPQKSSRIRRDHNGSHGQQDQGRHSRRNWEHGFLNRECAVEVTRAIRYHCSSVTRLSWKTGTR